MIQNYFEKIKIEEELSITKKKKKFSIWLKMGILSYFDFMIKKNLNKYN